MLGEMSTVLSGTHRVDLKGESGMEWTPCCRARFSDESGRRIAACCCYCRWWCSGSLHPDGGGVFLEAEKIVVEGRVDGHAPGEAVDDGSVEGVDEPGLVFGVVEEGSDGGEGEFGFGLGREEEEQETLSLNF